MDRPATADMAVDEMSIEQVIFRELPPRYLNLTGNKLGFAKRVRGSWKKGLSVEQERFARNILRGLIFDEEHGTADYCGEGGLIDDDDTPKTGARDAVYAEF